MPATSFMIAIAVAMFKDLSTKLPNGRKIKEVTCFDLIMLLFPLFNPSILRVFTSCLGESWVLLGVSDTTVGFSATSKKAGKRRRRTKRRDGDRGGFSQNYGAGDSGGLWNPSHCCLCFLGLHFYGGLCFQVGWDPSLIVQSSISTYRLPFLFGFFSASHRSNQPMAYCLHER